MVPNVGAAPGGDASVVRPKARRRRAVV